MINVLPHIHCESLYQLLGNSILNQFYKLQTGQVRSMKFFDHSANLECLPPLKANLRFHLGLPILGPSLAVRWLT
jgi:hypothetical protein